MSRLDGHVPYTVAIGNHDFDIWDASNTAWQKIRQSHDTKKFNAAFPRTKFSGLPSFGDTYPDRTNDNSYHLFSAGGTDWLVVTLKFPPCPEVYLPDCESADSDWIERLDWAENVIARHPDRQVIVTTHDYMDGDAKRSAGGEALWSRVSKYANVSFIIGGHYRDAAWRVDPGEHKNPIYQLLVDYSPPLTGPRDPNDNSYFRIMEFDPARGTVASQTYSAHCQQNPDIGCAVTKTGDPHELVLTGVPFMSGSSGHRFSRGRTMTATASSAQPGYGAANVLDGDSRTIWHTPYDSSGHSTVSLPQSVTLDLQRIRITTGLRYGPRQPENPDDPEEKNGIVTGYDIYTSTDGESFTRVATGDWEFTTDPKSASWPATAARFVRFEVTETGSDEPWASAAELNVEYVTEPLAPREAQQASASSEAAEHPASEAIDGRQATMWHSDYDPADGAPTVPLPQTITVDLGSTYRTTGLYYTPRQDGSTNGVITGYNVYVSTDGSSYTKVASGRWSSGLAAKPASWSATPARYVRLEAIDSVPEGEKKWAQATEIDITYLP